MNTNNNAVTITNGKITACINGAIYTIDSTHPNYQKALDAIKAKDWEGFLDHVDLSRKVKDFVFNTEVEIKDGCVFYKGQPLHNALTRKIINFIKQDFPVYPIVNFLCNLMQNPSYRAVNELCDFLDAGELPYTEDGHFLAFKNVRADYKDIHSGTFDNSVGSICEMPRYKVDEDKDRTCSSGLHFCSIKYLPHFVDCNGGKTMVVKINPKDVVAIPADYNNTKGRTCKYEVVSESTDNWREKLDRGENGFAYDLYASDGGDFDNDEDQEDYSDGDSGDCDTEDNGCCGGSCHSEDNQYGKKPDGSLFHNLRDAFGKFTKKDVG